MNTPCNCIKCNPIIAVSLGRRIKEREEGIVQLSTRIIHCEVPDTYSRVAGIIDNLSKEISTLQAQLEHHPQA
jgi:hypothetical protein